MKQADNLGMSQNMRNPSSDKLGIGYCRCLARAPENQKAIVLSATWKTLLKE